MQAAPRQTPSAHIDGHVQMPVAIVVGRGQETLPPVRKMVPPPRQGKAVAVHQHQQPVKVPQHKKAVAQQQPASVPYQAASAPNKAIRAEMASMASELQSKNAQLSKADAALRHVTLMCMRCKLDCWTYCMTLVLLGFLLLDPPPLVKADMKCHDNTQEQLMY